MSLYDYKENDTYFPPGRYRVRVQSVKFVEANSGTEGHEVTFGDNKRRVKSTYWITEKANGRIARLAEACGMTDAEMRTMEPGSKVLQAWLTGKVCMIDVGIGEPNANTGKSYSEVIAVHSAIDVHSATATPKQVKTEKRDKPPSPGKEPPAVAVPAGRQEEPPPSDDDIPF